MERGDRALPRARSPSDEDDDRRDPFAERRRAVRHRRRRLGATRAAPPRAAGARRACAAARAPAVTSSKKRGSSRVSTRAWLRQVDVDDAGDPPGPRAHHDDARREEHRLGDRVRDEDDRRAAAAARSRAARGSAARASSRRARRTARPSAGAPARTRARARSTTRCCMPPESCHGWWSPKPLSSTSSSISATRSFALRAVPAEHLERQRDVLRDRAPVEEHGVLEDDPVVAVEPRLLRGLAVDRRPCPRVGWIRSPITRSSVDLPQPDGPISETNSPGCDSRSMSCSAVTFPAGTSS